MIFEPTHDMELVRMILTNPHCWAKMANDDAPPREKLECAEQPGTSLILVREDNGLLAGLFLLVSVGVPAVAEVHFCILPTYWGRGEEIGQEFVEWTWKETSLNELRGSTPAYNRLALKMALACGFQLANVTDDAVHRGGKPYAIIHTLIRRPE